VRDYEESHPWIDFTLDLGHVGHRTWMLLGEAESKCQHVAGTALPPAAAKRMHEIYLSKGIHGTASIEGNTLSEDDVLKRVRGELPLPPSQEYLGREIDNILKACNKIVNDVVNGRPLSLTPERVRTFNQMVLDGLDVDDDVIPGEFRTHSVGVANYRGAPAQDNEYLIARLCTWMDELRLDDPGMRFALATLKAILAHLYIAWIHPFGDGNGRTARLIEFQLMLQAGVPLPAAHLLSDHYNRTRDAYYRQLDRTSRRKPYRIEGFVHYALQGFVDELRLQLDEVRKVQMGVIWVNFVHEHFKGAETAARARQKHIVLDLHDSTVSIADLPNLSPRVARAYAGKQQKAVTRDVNALVEMGLLVRLPGKQVRANMDVVNAFLPLVANPSL
jgi:Fic family protein